MAYYIVLSIGLVVSLMFCIKRRKGFSVSNLMFKSVSSLCYLLTAAFALVMNSSANIYGSLIIFGGALGLVGDISLDLKGIYKKDESTYLIGGFIFFLIGHLFYSGAIIYSIKMKWWIVLICLAVSIAFSFANVAMSRVMKVHFGAYRNIAVFLSHFEKKYILLAIGAICFTLSDAILSSTFFGRGKDGSFYLFTNHFLYYAGQYLIASSVMFM